MAHRTCSEPDCGSTDYYAVGLCPSTEEQAFAFAVEQRARELSGAEHGVIPARFWREAIVEFATMGEVEKVA